MSDPEATRAPLRRNLGVTVTTLIASGGTLICCVLPALMVALGAGAALAGLVSAVPQIVWLSEHKALVFGLAFAMLTLSGVLLWQARTAPCPTDAALANACLRLRRTSVAIWVMALLCTVTGVVFAFVLPKFA